MTYSFDVVVVGAGVVGLACARHFAQNGYDTIVVESQSNFGMGISSRSSEVIHSGIYYRSSSLKSRLCIRGHHLLYEYCKTRNIAHKKIGKWIVAHTPNLSEKLFKLQQAGLDNGCDDLHFLDAAAIRVGEPELKAAAVLSSPSTGIIDSHAYMQSLVAELSSAGGIIVYRSPCKMAAQTKQGFDVQLEDTGETIISARWLVNACGLDATSFAQNISGLSESFVPQVSYAKGNYFSYTGKVPFQRLIYPVPEFGGLGVHLTLDLNGHARFGPDVEWINEIDYHVSESRKSKFAESIQCYWPACDENKLQPGYSGIRPKIGNQSDFLDDFLIQSEADHSVPRLINLFGIESPGLTASMAIAEYVFSTLVQERV